MPEVARLGRTLKMWREHVLARFETHGISNRGTEAVNLIERTRRLAHGFRTFGPTRSGCCSPHQPAGPIDEARPTLNSEEPAKQRLTHFV
jgi:hypothetical protein